MKNKAKKFESKCNYGIIYVGDPCYVMDEKVYSDWWGGEHGYKEGSFEHEVYSSTFAVCGTEHGDGSYEGKDQNGNFKKYSVDSGTIACVPSELWEEGLTCEEAEKYGSVIQTWELTMQVHDDGLFEFIKDDKTVLTILTNSDEDEEEDEYGEDNYHVW